MLEQLEPSLKDFTQASPQLTTGFTVINEFFNELAYNPGPNQGGFLFYLDWANHDLNSVVAQGDAHGAEGQALLYFNCAQLYPVNILKAAAGADPTANLILGLLNPPTTAQCKAALAPSSAAAKAASLRTGVSPDALTADRVFGQGPDADRAGAERGSGRGPLMQKRAPTLANILVIVLFALSCFGLLLFLWDSFGGPVPLKPKGYRFTVELSRTLALAEQSDVRISGVDVGHVVGLATHANGTTDVTVEMDHQYAPISSADRMVLRQKTLLGETYIELLPPGTPGPGGTEEGQGQPPGVEGSRTRTR